MTPTRHAVTGGRREMWSKIKGIEKRMGGLDYSVVFRSYSILMVGLISRDMCVFTFVLWLRYLTKG